MAVSSGIRMIDPVSLLPFQRQVHCIGERIPIITVTEAGPPRVISVIVTVAVPPAGAAEAVEIVIVCVPPEPIEMPCWRSSVSQLAPSLDDRVPVSPVQLLTVTEADDPAKT
jgi:hypothetical protein